MALADEANRYIDEHKPWQMIKLEGSAAEVQAVCTQGINLFRVLMTCLAPTIPFTAKKAEAFLGIPLDQWSSLDQPLLDMEINPFIPLMTRIDPLKVKAMIENSRDSLKPAAEQLNPDDGA